ncbi:MAG: PorT family protein, partial [Bacteroidota bacterium]|nr:PorT family protein [Bacteroidota bacterium]
MKRITLCLTLLSLFFISQAQTRVAIIGGVHSSTVKGDDVSVDDNTYGSRTGFHAGFLLDVPFSSHFSFQPAAMFTNKGRKSDNETALKPSQYVNYIDV